MKLIKQVKLFYQEGTSDKVYEIDLLQVGEDYVVNFRYGKRGTALKEGTKTIFPISITEAEKVFIGLEQEKRKKGYVATGEVMAIVASPLTTTKKSSITEKTVLKHLRSAVAGDEPENWTLSRIIWRAGELKITDAVPSILKLADYTDPMNLYSIVWALGRMRAEKGLTFITELLKKPGIPTHVTELAKAVQLELVADKDRVIQLETCISSLPMSFQSALRNNDAHALEIQVRDFLFNLKTSSNEYISTLYTLSGYNPTARKVLLNVLPQIPFEQNYFKHIRRVFKTAEMLEDSETYGIICKEIEKRVGAFGRTFSTETKEYLTKRILRNLKKAGIDESASYTKLASGILLAFDDESDKNAPYQEHRYVSIYNERNRNYTYQQQTIHFDAYAKFRAFNYILYANSSRYSDEAKAWKCVPPYIPGNATPDEREEAYRFLWNKAPEQIVLLLKATKAYKVQEFALKVFKANPSFESLLERDDLISLLHARFTETQQLAFDLVKKSFDPRNPDKVLLLAVLGCQLTEAREQGYQWILAEKINLLADTVFVSDLIKINHPDTQLWLRSLLTSTDFKKEESQIIIARIISWLLQQQHIDHEYFSLIIDTLVIGFQENLKHISLTVITDLLKNEAVIFHELAGKILIKHDVKPEDLPEELLLILLTSSHPSSRSLGLQLLAKFPENLLLEKKSMLVSFCISPLQDVRSAVKPIIARLNVAYPSFGNELIELFVPAFLMAESYEGLHDDLLQLLTGELKESLKIIDTSRTLTLLNARFRSAQKLGAFLLITFGKADELTITNVLKLADNQLEDVRKYAWEWYNQHEELVKTEKTQSIRVLDAEWLDTRIFAFNYFKTQFTVDDWTTELLVSICDSNQDDVQAFGKEMITACFKTEQGNDYLLKLSQHPNTKIQLFTTSYLEAFAKDNFETLKSLNLYFITVLSQVNKGKAAKARVLEFLRKEALKTEEAAGLIIEIFNRVSLSVAISERAACIHALREIKKAYPNSSSVAVVNEYPDYIRN